MLCYATKNLERTVFRYTFLKIDTMASTNMYNCV